MNANNRAGNARAEAVLGEDALRAAQALLQLGLYNDAVSRAYYAAFHYARALLLLDGLEPKTHRGVVALLLERYERTAVWNLARCRSSPVCRRSAIWPIRGCHRHAPRADRVRPRPAGRSRTG